MRRDILFYLAILTLCGAAIVGVLSFGSHLQPEGARPAGPAAVHPEPAAGGIAGVLRGNLQHPLGVLLLQIIVIVLAARATGAVFRKIGQPAVIGEMVAGILLGPSVLGLLSPATEAFLFPPASLGDLKLLSQIGVILFMFVVGTELDVEHLRRRAHAAVVVSHASIVVPFALGTAFSLLIFRTFAPAGTSFSAFALFMGVAMSITAFPVLARILEERGLSRSYLGSTAITCAAVDDVTAWCLLALVVAIVQAAGLGQAVWTLALVLFFVAGMLFVLKPRIGRLLGRSLGDEARSPMLLAGVLTFAFACALVTEVIGIHALFGAFLAGVILPSHAGLRSFLKERLGTFGSVFLLPLFFAFTGLRTRIDLLDDGRSWLVCGGIVAVAVAGKLGGSMLAARWVGMGWRDAAAIGALMNTRGLMELIVLNIGYDLGILSPRVFAMMVIMALATTFMTGPLLAWLGVGLPMRASAAPEGNLAA